MSVGDAQNNQVQLGQFQTLEWREPDVPGRAPIITRLDVYGHPLFSMDANKVLIAEAAMRFGEFIKANIPLRVGFHYTFKPYELPAEGRSPFVRVDADASAAHPIDPEVDSVKEAPTEVRKPTILIPESVAWSKQVHRA
jgi:hypothetical protein